MPKYWEAFGKVRSELLKIHEERVKARDAILAFMKEQKAQQYAICESFGVHFSLFFKKPDLKIWKRCRGSDCLYMPRTASKQGKELAQRMRKLGADCPSGTDINRAIGFDNWFQGGRWLTAGYIVVGKRILFVTDECYHPPKKFLKDIKRISDVAYERLAELKKSEILRKELARRAKSASVKPRK